MEARRLALVAVFSALMFVVASTNRLFHTIAHVTLDAVLCTCLLVVLMEVVKRPGVATSVGFVTGLLMVLLGSPAISIVAWSVRGFVLDLVVYGLFRGRNRGIACYGVAAFAAFFLQSVVGRTLYLLLFMGIGAWLSAFRGIFLPLIAFGSALSLVGVYLALKCIAPRVARIAGDRV